MTQPNLAALYRTRTEARLEAAGLLLTNNPAFQFDAADNADLARSNAGMMIWSAAIDQGSALLIQERRTIPTGRSPQISQFITRDLHSQHPALGLDVAWSMLLQLHNIQHRAGHPPARFATAATAARRSFAVLNHLLHPASQIDPRSYSWLARVRASYVNPFRDDPPTLWSLIPPGNLNTPDPSTGAAPLHWAAHNHNADAVETLISQGAHVGARDNSRQTPLHWAGRAGTPQTIHSLIHHGADVGDRANLGTALHYAAGFNAYDTVEALINSQSDVNKRDINDETPLHWAARWQEDAAVAQLLINAGASKTIRSFTGQTPYDTALASGSYFADLLV